MISNKLPIIMTVTLMSLIVANSAMATTMCAQMTTIFPSQNKQIVLNPTMNIDDFIIDNMINFTPAICYLNSSYEPSSEQLDKLDLYIEPINLKNTSASKYAVLNDIQIGIGLKVSDTAYNNEKNGWKIGTVDLEPLGIRFKLVEFDLQNKYWAWHKVMDFRPGNYKIATISNLVKAAVYDGNVKVAEYPISTILNYGLIIQNSSCSFNNTNVQKRLVTVDKSTFSGVNSTGGYSQVVIQITCTQGSFYNIKVSSLEPIYDIPGHLVARNSLNNASALEGVGVELLYDNQPIPKIGEEYIIKNDKLPIINENGSAILNFGAQYHQVDETIKIGDITSYFMLNINYN